MKPRSTARLALPFAAAIAALLAAPPAHATVRTWANLTTAWGTAGNWSLSGVPGSGDDALFSSSIYSKQPSLGTNFALGEFHATGSGSLSVSGSGKTLTLNANGSTSGTGIWVEAGAGAVNLNTVTLTLGTTQNWVNDSANTLTAGGAVNLGSYALTVKGSGTTSLTGAISTSGGSLTKDGTGTLSISGTNTYAGNTIITNGALSFQNTGALSANTTVTVAAGATAGLGVGGTGSFTSANVDSLFSGSYSTITMNATSLVGIDTTAGDFTYSTNVSATTRGLNKLGAGTLTLNGTTSAYTGPTTLTAGTLSVGASANLGNVASNLVFNGGTLQITGATLTSFSGIGHTISYTAGQTVALDINSSSNTFTVDQVLAQGTGGFTKLGAGTVILNQTNTFSGPVTVQNGTLSVATVTDPGTNGPLGSGGATTTSRVTLGSATQIGTLEYTGATAATAKQFNLFQGVIQVDNASAILTLDGSGNAINASNGASTTLTKTGPGTLNFIYGSTNFTAAQIILTGGTISASGSASALGASTTSLVLNGGTTLDFNDTANRAHTHAVTVNGSMSIISEKNAPGSGVNYSLGTLTIGASTLTVGGGNVNSGTAGLLFGTTTLSGAATFNITNPVAGGATLLTIGALTNAGNTLTLKGNGGFAQGAAIASGGGGLTLDGTFSGTATLNQTNLYTGATTLSGGTLSAGVTANLGTSAANLVFDGGALQITGTTLTNISGIGHTVSFNATKTVGLDINNAANTFTVDQVLNQTSGGFTKLGAGTAILNQANTYSGGTTLNQGALTVSGGGTLGATTGALSVNNTNSTAAGTNAVLNLVTSVDTTVGSLSGTIATPTSGTNTATINNGGSGRNFTVNQTIGGNYSGVIAGAGSFTLGSLSTSTLTLSGANTYTGGTSVTGGTLTFSGYAAQPSSGTLAISGGATVNLNNSVSGDYWPKATVTGAGTLNLPLSFVDLGVVSPQADMSGFSGTWNISGSKALVTVQSPFVSPASSATINVGSGTTLYLGWNGTTVLGCKVQLNGADDGEGFGQLRVENNAQQNGPVILNANSSIGGTSGIGYIGGAISDGGNHYGFAKVGASTLVLSSTNTYSGPTTVNAGTLLLNGSNTGGGTVSVASGATLGGTGSTTGAVIVNGTLSPGASIAKLTSGALTFNDGSTFAYEMNHSALAAVAGDLQIVTGGSRSTNLSLGGTVKLTLTDLADLAGAFAPNTTLSLIQYVGNWNGGIFTYGDSTLLENNGVFADTYNNHWRISYNSASGGANLATSIPGSHFVTLTSLTAIPEPDSLLALGCLIGSGVLLRRRK